MQGPNDRSAGRGVRSGPTGRKALPAKKTVAPKAAGPKAAKQTAATPAKAAKKTAAAPAKRTVAGKAAATEKGAPAPSLAPRARPGETARPDSDRRVPRQATTGARRLAPPGQVPRHLPPPRVSELDRSYIRGLRRVIMFLLVLGVAGFLLDGSNRPANPRLVPATDPNAVKGLPAYGSATLTVTSSRRKDACVLEAVTQAQQQAGLMRRTTVAPFAGMAFVFGQPSTDSFWMKDTVIPLSVAFFDAGGRYESSVDMPPCPATTKVCPTYKSSEPYELALEVPAGHLKGMGIGSGSTISLGGACTG